VVPRLPSRRLPRGFLSFGRLPPRSDLATSYWKAQCRLVLAVSEDEGSCVTRCGHMWCLGRGETTSLLPGVQMESLGQPTIDPASSLFPPSVQALAVVAPPSSATPVVCRRDQQRMTDHRRPLPAPADTAQGRGKERSRGRWAPRVSASSLGFQDVILLLWEEQDLDRYTSCRPRGFWT
jgi:hypothetical protein